MIIEQILNRLKDCDDFHNRCDYLLEHNEITYLLKYITELNERINRAREYIENNDIIDGRLHNPHKNYGSVDELYQVLKGE